MLLRPNPTSKNPNLKQTVQAFLRAPDSLMLEIGAGGELVVARIRLWLVLMLWLIALGAVFVNPDRWTETRAGTLTSVLVGLTSVLALILARRVGRYPWLPWFTVTGDVTVTTFGLTLLLLASGPEGIHRHVAWVCYLVSIVLTALRNDSRLSLYSGLLALAQYLALAAYTISHYPTELLHNASNVISWATVTQRAIILIIFTLITTTIVERMRRLVRLAGTDSLTGLPNRNWFFNTLPKQIARATQQNQTLSISIIDLDHFKAVNDEIGHLAGDQALQHVVHTVQSRLNRHEWMARLGGEEFVIVFNTPAPQAAQKLDQLRQAVANSTFLPHPNQPARPLTFSAGLATAPHDGMTVSDLLSHADERLYKAKEHGRNRIVVTDD